LYYCSVQVFSVCDRDCNSHNNQCLEQTVHDSTQTNKTQRNFRTQLSCWQPDCRKLTSRIAAVFENFDITKTQKVVTQV
jgi:hypothetical protein